MVETRDGHGRLELTQLHAPSGRGGDRHVPPNTPGIRHSHAQSTTSTPSSLACEPAARSSLARWSAYEDSDRLCHVRGPEGIIVELAEQVG